MDAEGLGRKLLLTPSGDPRGTLEMQTVGAVTASPKMLTLQALSTSLNAGAGKGGCLSRGEAFGCPPAVCPPERPRPFTHYRFKSVCEHVATNGIPPFLTPRKLRFRYPSDFSVRFSPLLILVAQPLHHFVALQLSRYTGVAFFPLCFRSVARESRYTP